MPKTFKNKLQNANCTQISEDEVATFKPGRHSKQFRFIENLVDTRVDNRSKNFWCFEFKLLEIPKEGPYCFIGVLGLPIAVIQECNEEYEHLYLPGWEQPSECPDMLSFGYHFDDGTIRSGESGKKDGLAKNIPKAGDSIGVFIDFESKIVCFLLGDVVLNAKHHFDSTRDVILNFSTLEDKLSVQFNFGQLPYKTCIKSLLKYRKVTLDRLKSK